MDKVLSFIVNQLNWKRQMNKKEKELYKAIDEIIWNDWDAIGVNDYEEARDEYYGYLPQLFKILKEGKNRNGIADFLNQIATINMGLMGNKDRDERIAELLIQKRNEILEK